MKTKCIIKDARAEKAFQTNFILDVNKEFKVYDVSSSTLPVIYGTSLDLVGSNPLYGVSYATATNIVYGVNHAATKNFFIIAP